MTLSIAEYLGQRTDVAFPNIIPSEHGGNLVPACPFSGAPCRKLASKDPQHPVCSVRVFNNTHQGQPFIVCSDRLIPANATALSATHIAALASVANIVFPGANARDIGFRRQVGINLENTRLVLDYVLQIDPTVAYPMPRKVILEVQGGGETNSTGTITRYINDWIASENPTNEFLSQKLTTSYLRRHTGQTEVGVPNIIPNNAWKRQLDQILKKAVLTMHFGGAFALVMGEVLYDYITQSSIRVKREFFPNWEIALMGICEKSSTQPGALQIVDVTKASFMTYNEFITALQAFSIPTASFDPFTGQFTTLRNRTFSVSP